MSQTQYTVSIIIPVWNNWDLTQACLRSIKENTSGIDYQVVLVDNASTDQTPKAAPLLGNGLFGERFSCLRMPGNDGFAKACNQGAWASSAKYLFFLNNDTEVTPGWLPPLLSAITEDTRLSGVGSLLLFPEDGSVRGNRVQHLGITCSHGPEFRHLYELFPHTHPVVAKRRKLRTITAAAMLMPARLFKAEQGFFEGFVNGMEDVDLCHRIAGRGGYFSVVPESVIYHFTHGTEGRFNHESENLRMLLGRCRHMHEDLYDLVADDGYILKFTPWLDLALAPPEERTLQLEQLFQSDPTTAHLYALLNLEPLWDNGYVTLIRMLKDEDRTQEAMPIAYFRSILCPSLEAYRQCAEIIRLCGIEDMASKYAFMLLDLQNALADRQGLAKKTRSITRNVKHPLVLDALNDRIAD